MTFKLWEKIFLVFLVVIVTILNFLAKLESWVTPIIILALFIAILFERIKKLEEKNVWHLPDPSHNRRHTEGIEERGEKET